jgi:hypothetical protein
MVTARAEPTGRAIQTDHGSRSSLLANWPQPSHLGQVTSALFSLVFSLLTSCSSRALGPVDFIKGSIYNPPYRNHRGGYFYAHHSGGTYNSGLEKRY